MRIHTAIISITLLVTAILTFFLTYYLVDVERQDALADLENTITRNDNLLKLVNLAPLYNLDRRNLEVNLDSFFTDQNMIEITLEEYDGDIHISLTKEDIPGSEYIYSKVILIKGDIELGEIRTIYSTSIIEQNLVGARNKHLFFSTILLISFSFIIYFLVKHFTSPIERLTKAAKLIADGDLDKEVETSGAYELVTLGQSFDSMRNAVKEKISDLAHQNEALEQEISTRRETEEALKSSEKKFTSLFMATPVITTLTTLEDDTFLDVNNAFTQVTGYSRKDVIGKKSCDINFFADPELHRKTMQTTKELGVTQHQELRLLTKDQESIDVIWFVEKLRMSDQELLLNVLLDVTERKNAEAENVYLRNLLKNTFDSMPSTLVGVNFDGNITQWNQHASETTGIGAHDAVGNLFSTILPITLDLLRIQEAITNKKTYKEGKLSLPQGDHVFDITVYPLIEGDAKEAVIRIDDVTERVRIEEMIVQSEKMLSVGGLAAGMAHEINNPLAGIMQNIQVIANRTKIGQRKNDQAAEGLGISMDQVCGYMEKREIYPMIDAIMDSSKRAAKIVENMLNFSRKSTSEHSQVNLPELLDQTIELAASDYDLKKNFDFKHIEIIRQYDEQLPPVTCDHSKIQQVLLNLLTNGAQAMENGCVNDEHPRFICTIKQDRGRVAIEIVDNGPGMKQAVCKRVFEPFFTTKAVGKGTGLGLSVSYFIITEDHNGEMTVQSSPNQGAKFSFSLPIKG